MKIAVLCPTLFTFQGVSRIAWQQAADFASQGNDVVIFTLLSNMKPPQGVNLQVMGMPHSFIIQRLYSLLFPLDIVKMIKWIPKFKEYDVIYSHEYPLNWLAYFSKRFYQVKYIFYNHHFNPPEVFSGILERVYIRIKFTLEKWTLRTADGAISISQYSRAQLKSLTGLDSEVIYNKIDTNRFHGAIDGTIIRNKYLLGKAPVILFVGHISPSKGVHVLISAFSLIRQVIPDARLLIVGKHHYANYSRDLAKISDNSVIFAGDVSDEDLPLYYAACDLYATATQWEGFDMPLAEAQACGKPVVAFDIGPHTEVVKNKEAGILVPSGDTEAMAEAIISILQAT